MPARNIKHFVAKLTICFSKKISWSKTTTIYSLRLKGSNSWSWRGWRQQRVSWRWSETPLQAWPGDKHHPRILNDSIKCMHIFNFVDTCLGTSRILQRRREQGDCCCHCRSCCCRCCRGEEPGAPRTLMMEESSKTLILMVIVWSSSQPGTRVWLGIQSVTGERRIGWLALNTITQGHRTQWVRGAAAMMKSQWINNCISLLQAFDMTVLDNVRYGTRYVPCTLKHWWYIFNPFPPYFTMVAAHSK